MSGRDFLDIARELLAGATPAHRRAASGRAYYALLLEARELLRRWGFAPPPRDRVHSFVRLRFVYTADPSMQKIGIDLDELGQLRNKADYDLADSRFRNDTAATDAIDRTAASIDSIDQIEVDAARRACIVADIQARWP